jgi:GT2 family glycosyltransferase
MADPSATPSAVPDVAVAIVSYNTRDILRDCLRTVVANGPSQIVVADNGSTDGSAEMVRAEFPSARVVVDEGNPGYGAAANHAVAACDAPYVLLLNSDTLLPAGTLAPLREYMESHPRAAMVGPRLRHGDGSLHRSCFAFPSATFLVVEQSPLRALARWIPPLRRHYFIDWEPDAPRVVPWVYGAALMLRRTAFESVGGYDPAFYMYYEEVDLAYRLAQAGWETHVAPVAEITHLGGASTSRVWAPMKEQNFRSLIRFGAHHMSRARSRRLAVTLEALIRAKARVESARRLLVRDPARRHELGETAAFWRHLSRVPFTRELEQMRLARASVVRDAAAGPAARAAHV